MSHVHAQMRHEPVKLGCALSLRNAFCFPIQNRIARREIFVGACWLLVPVYGWLLNMGHRIEITHNMLNGRPGWPAWRGHATLLRHGCITFAGMVLYHAPATICFAVAVSIDSTILWWLGALLWALGTCAVPGYMTAYCLALDPREVFNPARAIQRVRAGGFDYWKAWAIVLICLVISTIGLLGLGIGFLLTSVWFWQSAAFCFATVMHKSMSISLEECRPSNHVTSSEVAT